MELALQGQDDALADSPDAGDRSSEGCVERRVVAAQDERTQQLDGFEPLPDDAALERFHIDADVGQLRHGGILRAVAGSSSELPA